MEFDSDLDYDDSQIDVDDILSRVRDLVQEDRATTEQNIEDDVLVLQRQIQDRSDKIKRRESQIAAGLAALGIAKTELRKQKRLVLGLRKMNQQLRRENKIDDNQIKRIESTRREAKERLRKVGESIKVSLLSAPPPLDHTHNHCWFSLTLCQRVWTQCCLILPLSPRKDRIVGSKRRLRDILKSSSDAHTLTLRPQVASETLA